MPRYKKRDYHTDWSKAKKEAKLDDKLFKQGLGPKLDDLNKLYAQLMKAGPKDWKALYDKHSDLAVKVNKIVKDYRLIVNANGKNAKVLKVLDSISESKVGAMVWDMALDKGELYQRMKR